MNDDCGGVNCLNGVCVHLNGGDARPNGESRSGDDARPNGESLNDDGVQLNDGDGGAHFVVACLLPPAFHQGHGQYLR